MNDSSLQSTPGASLAPDTTSIFTAAHLVVIAILAVLTIVAILYGMRLKRRRKAAETAVDEHRDAIDEATPTPTVSSSPASVDRLTTPPAEMPAPSLPTDDVEPIAASDRLADEPIPASAPMENNPAAEAAAPDSGPVDDAAERPVTLLKGLGPKVAARLGELGITTVGQLAALDDAEAERLDAQLGSFRGRMARDRWIEQARFLAAGDTAGFEAVFGRL